MTQKIEQHKITAGDKCAFYNMISATKGAGWTPATKVLAFAYLDLSEKHGHAFASQPYLVFRTGLSKRTMSRSNRAIEASGWFDLEYHSDDTLSVKPNLSRLRDALARYQVRHRGFVEERRAKMSAGDRQNGRRGADKMAEGYRQNGRHNPSTQSLNSNHSTDSFPSASRRECRIDSNDARVSNATLQAEYRTLCGLLPEQSEHQEFGPTKDSDRGGLFHYMQARRDGFTGCPPLTFEQAKLAVQAYAAEPNRWWQSPATFFSGTIFDYWTHDTDRYLGEGVCDAANDNNLDSERPKGLRAATT